MRLNVNDLCNMIIILWESARCCVPIFVSAYVTRRASICLPVHDLFFWACSSDGQSYVCTYWYSNNQAFNSNIWERSKVILDTVPETVEGDARRGRHAAAPIDLKNMCKNYITLQRCPQCYDPILKSVFFRINIMLRVFITKIPTTHKLSPPWPAAAKTDQFLISQMLKYWSSTDICVRKPNR